MWPIADDALGTYTLKALSRRYYLPYAHIPWMKFGHAWIFVENYVTNSFQRSFRKIWRMKRVWTTFNPYKTAVWLNLKNEHFISKGQTLPKRANDVRKSFVKSERFLSAIHNCLCIHYAIWTQYLYVKVLESPNICVCILQKSRIMTYDLRNIYWSIALKICKIHMNCVILNRLNALNSAKIT